MSDVNSLSMRYRGFRMGYVVTDDGRYIPAWVSSMESAWSVGEIICPTVPIATRLTRKCLDLICAFEVEEVQLGRKLTADEYNRVCPLS